MTLIKEEFLGFEFVKVGSFHLGKNPYEYTLNGERTTWETPTIVELDNKEFINAECSAYLVCLGSDYKKENILYVGEYTNTFKERWLRRHYDKQMGIDEWLCWHSDNLSNNINKLLKIIKSKKDCKETWDVGSPRGKEKKVKKLSEKLSVMFSYIRRLSVEPEISVWLTVDPWIKNPNPNQNQNKVNISRSIEQVFLASNLPLPLNSKGRSQPSNSSIEVKKIESVV